MKLLNAGMTERRINGSTIELKTFGCAFDKVNIVLKLSPTLHSRRARLSPAGSPL